LFATLSLPYFISLEMTFAVVVIVVAEIVVGVVGLNIRVVIASAADNVIFEVFYVPFDKFIC